MSGYKNERVSLLQRADSRPVPFTRNLHEKANHLRISGHEFERM